MSRIGNKPVKIDAGVTVSLEGKLLKIKGPKGELTYFLPDEIDIKIENNLISFSRNSDTKRVKSLHGLARSIVKNHIIGVTKGYEKELEIFGVGYRCQMKGEELQLQVGHTHPVSFKPAKGIKFSVEGQTRIKVSGVDKQLVGQIARDIRSMRSPDSYKGKGIRFVGERIKLKAGKTGAK